MPEKSAILELRSPRSVYGTLSSTTRLSDEPVPRRRLYLNAALLSFGWFFLFAGINPVLLLQSSLNAAGGLGVAAMAVQHGVMVVGSVLSAPVVRRIGCKWAVVIGGILNSTFVAANLAPSWASLMTTAAVSGLAASVLWTAHRVYMARLAHLHAALTATDIDRAQSRAFVLTTVSYKMSATVGHLISSVMLSAPLDGGGGGRHPMTMSRNQSLEACGAHYCNEVLPVAGAGGADAGEEARAAAARVRALVGVCMASCALGCILFGFVDPLKRLGVKETGGEEERRQQLRQGGVGILGQAKEIAAAVLDPIHLLLIPMAVVLGAADSFWAADFTKAFVTCALGVQWVGYVSLWNGVSGALAGVILGWFNRRRVRSLPFAVATLLQVVVLTAMFYWTASGDTWRDYQMMAFMACGWFFGSGTRQFVVPALYAVLFPERLEMAFAVFHLWSFIGSTVMFSISSVLCMEVKMYGLFVLLAASFLGYLGVEFVVLRKHKRMREIVGAVVTPPLLVKPIK